MRPFVNLVTIDVLLIVPATKNALNLIQLCMGEHGRAGGLVELYSFGTCSVPDEIMI